MPSEQEMWLHRCCFTGHRPEKLAQSPEEVQQWLRDRIKDAMLEYAQARDIDVVVGGIIPLKKKPKKETDSDSPSGSEYPLNLVDAIMDAVNAYG